MEQDKKAWKLRLEEIWRTEWKDTFLTAFVVGMLTHLYLFTNNLLTWDSLFSLYAPQEMTAIGRPLLRYFCGLSTDFNLPLVLGTLSVLYLSLTAVALTECFAIHSKMGRRVTAALVVTFPVTAGTFCYLFTADGYMLAFLLSVVSVLLAERGACAMEGEADAVLQGEEKPHVRIGKFFGWILAGAAVLAVSLGIYQAYFAVTMTLCMLKLLLFLVQKSWKGIFFYTKAYLGMGIVGYGCYLVLVKVFRLCKQTELLGYNGIDRLDHFVFADVPRGIYTAYRQFASFALHGNVLTTNLWMTLCVLGLLLLGCGLYLRSLWQMGTGLWKRLLVAVGLVCLLPVGATIFCVMSPDVFLYILLRMPWVLFFLFVLAMVERDIKDWTWVRPGVIGLTAILAFQFYLMDNVVYYNMNEKYEKSYALSVRIVDRIEQTEGYYPWIQTLFVGAEPDYEKYPSTEVTKEVLSGYYPARSDFFLNSTDKYAEFFSHYLSVSLAPVSDEVEQELLQREEIRQMGTFPAADAVQIIDGVLVVKMSDS